MRIDRQGGRFVSFLVCLFFFKKKSRSSIDGRKLSREKEKKYGSDLTKKIVRANKEKKTPLMSRRGWDRTRSRQFKKGNEIHSNRGKMTRSTKNDSTPLRELPLVFLLLVFASVLFWLLARNVLNR